VSISKASLLIKSGKLPHNEGFGLPVDAFADDLHDALIIISAFYDKNHA